MAAMDARVAPAGRRIGLLGGMSWESSALYYAIVNEAVRERLGGFHSARVLLASLDFAEPPSPRHGGYGQEQAEIIHPLRELFALVREVSAIVSLECGAFG